MCKVCLSEKADHIFINCGHLVSCGTCIESLKKKCPLCRQTGAHKKIYIWGFINRRMIIAIMIKF